MNLEKHIWEGWTVNDFIYELSDTMNLVMRYNPLKTRGEVKKWCMSNQPYYKKYIPEVVDYFTEKYNIK